MRSSSGQLGRSRCSSHAAPVDITRPPGHHRREPDQSEEAAMSKRGRKRRARKKSGANHGKRPNA
ncbi:hypothetical protein GCU49_14795 [Modestobacter roseus]|nr:hypothetical protein [Modestobacter roseus]